MDVLTIPHREMARAMRIKTREKDEKRRETLNGIPAFPNDGRATSAFSVAAAAGESGLNLLARMECARSMKRVMNIAPKND